MKNNSEKTLIRCSIRAFDCAHSKAVFTGDYSSYDHFCELPETDCERSYMYIKHERKEKLNKMK